MNKTKAPLDHYQPDVKFKDEFPNEEEKKIYLSRLNKGKKKISSRYNNRVAYEE